MSSHADVSPDTLPSSTFKESSSASSPNSPRESLFPRQGAEVESEDEIQDLGQRRRQVPRHVHVASPSCTSLSGSGFYYKPHVAIAHSPASPNQSPTPRATPPPRRTVSHLQLDPLLSGAEDLDTYGVHEMRDGFFEATFDRPIEPKRSFVPECPETLEASQWNPIKDMKSWSQRQWQSFGKTAKATATSRTGIQFLKSFLGFFLAYLVCLIPASRIWLGQHNLMLPLSVLINHPGRSVGAQLDGATFMSIGTVLGLLWGCLGQVVARSTAAAREGDGGLIALFLAISTLVLGWARCCFPRLYQAVIASGISVFYMSLSGPTDLVNLDLWPKFSTFIIPWELGQALGLVVCVGVFPAGGTMPLALVPHHPFSNIKAKLPSESFHRTMSSIGSALGDARCCHSSTTPELGLRFVEVSQAVRDFTIDSSFSRFTPQEAVLLRNAIQGVIRSIMAIRPRGNPFNRASTAIDAPSPDAASSSFRLVTDTFHHPCVALEHAIEEAIRHVDVALMEISGYRCSNEPDSSIRSDVGGVKRNLQKCMDDFDGAEETLINHQDLAPFHTEHSGFVDLFFHITPTRRAAGSICDLLDEVLKIQNRVPCMSIHLPSYPWSKALFRMNAQVRHDRGGLTATNYFRSKRMLRDTMTDLQSRPWIPGKRSKHGPGESRAPESLTDPSKSRKVGYVVWKCLHRLQDFEARFSFKVTLVAILLSAPAFAPQSRGWWIENDCWWTVVTVWIMMHPRIGGNFGDLCIRTSFSAFGSLFGALAYGSGGGSPYVMAVFAFIFILPMMFRYTVSQHPRSGIMACLSFTVVSLTLNERNGMPSTGYVAWTRGVALVVGCFVAITVNWLIWPFLARHELRKSISTTMLHSAILYRRLISKYVYHDVDHQPGSEDNAWSEMLEGRLREGFVGMRQLQDLTHHEIVRVSSIVFALC